MKKYFLTGLALLLPIALTLAIVTFVVNVLTAPFIGFVKPLLGRWNLFQDGFLFLSARQVLQYGSQGLILLLLFACTVLLGWLTRWFFMHYFIRVSDYILHRIPLFNTIYKTSQEVIKTIFASETRSFKQVALVPFPNVHTQSIGLVTKEGITGLNKQELTAVFVPTTPNPTSGFMILFNRDDITLLDMAVEDAFKYIISCGVIPTPIREQQPGAVEAAQTASDQAEEVETDILGETEQE